VIENVIDQLRSGSKVVKFGQQTNMCAGLSLVNGHIIAATVDGMIRVFSIEHRAMLAQYKVSDLCRPPRSSGTNIPSKGSEMIIHFHAEGRFMTVSSPMRG
jgi:pyrimidine and pyridine-specific 5'-nucleotidase